MLNDVSEFQLGDCQSSVGSAPFHQFPHLDRLYGSEHAGHLALPLSFAEFPPYPASKHSEFGKLVYNPGD